MQSTQYGIPIFNDEDEADLNKYSKQMADAMRRQIEKFSSPLSYIGEVETYEGLNNVPNAKNGEICTVLDENKNYIFNGESWIEYSNVTNLEKIELSKTYKGSNITAPTIEGFGKIKKLYGKAEGVGNSESIEITSKNGENISTKKIYISTALKENDYIDFINQKIVRSDGTEEKVNCTCGIVQYEGETEIYNSEDAEMEIELTNNKAISSTNSNIVGLQTISNDNYRTILDRLAEKVDFTGDIMIGILNFENKKEFEAIRKIRTIDNVDYMAKLGIGASKSVSLELSADGQTLGRLDIMADGTIKNYKTGNLLIEEGKWITATLNSGVKATDSGLGGCKGIKYRKIGNHVFVIGSVSTTYDGTNQVVLTTLPEGYRPKFLNYTFCPLTGSNIARIYIANDGRLVLEWVKSIANGNNVTNELSWVSTKIDFFVD